MKIAFLSSAAVALSLLAATAASAGVTVTAVDGTGGNPNPIVYDFETVGTTPVMSGGGVVTHDPGNHAAPFGGTPTHFYSVGPSTSSPGTLDFTGIGDIKSISFLWGSVDDYNYLEILGNNFAAPPILAFFGGQQGVAPADQNQSHSMLVTLVFDTVSEFGGLRLTSGTNAFEIDDISIFSGGIPEPSTWAMMILGIGFAGAAMRRSRQTVSVKYA